jgi:AraC-like DNA-binding protein
MILKDFLPSPHLREYFRLYQSIRFKFGDLEVIPHKVYCPRPEVCLGFYLRDLQFVSYDGGREIQGYPRTVISGQHTVVTNKYTGGDCWLLQIVLQPNALFRLTGIPTYELTNRYIDAASVWGKDIRETQERICQEDDVSDVIRIVEKFLDTIIKKSKQQFHKVDAIGIAILQQKKPLSIDRLASDACLSSRQFHRKFTERTGIGPKLFDKVVRFEKAFFMKNANPELDWLSIALACGYYDYQHLVKDYKYFTNMTPTAFYELDTKAPERAFGVVEVRQEL